MGTTDHGRAHRQRAVTWVLGGALLIASAISDYVGSTDEPWSRLDPWSGFADVLFAASAVLLALGIGRAASVTAFRPIGTGAVIGYAVVRLCQPYLIVLAGSQDDAVSQGVDVSASGEIGTIIALEAAALVLGLIATVHIGVVHILPRPWCWMPLLVLCVVTVSPLLPFFAPDGLYGSSGWTSRLYEFSRPVPAWAVSALGAILIAIGGWEATRSATRRRD